ncbi:MAG: formylglycine-generating enzyme family protein [Candidatus Electryoneaceae bacterium]|nr:formylglycine-generating enzyme family protein [Candidatus Electryoneaceae bacterium]
MGKYEVTNRQFAVYYNARGDEWIYPVGYEDIPVVNISWVEATAFCRWLSDTTGEEYRLPTEAQWEYACRAGTETVFSFGNDAVRLVKYGWIGSNSDGMAYPVAKLLPNLWGLYDMHGNVWEWCLDWFGEYSVDRDSDCVIDPKGVSDGLFRVMRGGSWKESASVCEVSNRAWGKPELGREDVGFRLVRIIRQNGAP